MRVMQVRRLPVEIMAEPFNHEIAWFKRLARKVADIINRDLFFRHWLARLPVNLCHFL